MKNIDLSFKPYLSIYPEKIVKAILNPEKKENKEDQTSQSIQYIYQEIENKLKEKLSRKVQITSKGKNGAGKIEIEFYSNDDLDRLIEQMENMWEHEVTNEQ